MLWLESLILLQWDLQEKVNKSKFKAYLLSERIHNKKIFRTCHMSGILMWIFFLNNTFKLSIVSPHFLLLQCLFRIPRCLCFCDHHSLYCRAQHYHLLYVILQIISNLASPFSCIYFLSGNVLILSVEKGGKKYKPLFSMLPVSSVCSSRNVSLFL